jgi:hypothetical protein
VELLIKMKKETNDAFWAFRSIKRVDVNEMCRKSVAVRISLATARIANGVVTSHGCEI